jgi:hypothetical protein
MTQKIQRVPVYVAPFGPLLRTTSNQEPPIRSHCVMGAEYIAIWRGYGHANQRVRTHIVYARLSKVASWFLLRTPMLIAAKENDLPFVTVGYQSRMHS